MVGSACDITRQFDADLQVQAGERLLRTVLDLLPMGVFWKDCEGGSLGANKAFLAHYGVERVNGCTDAALAMACAPRSVRAAPRGRGPRRQPRQEEAAAAAKACRTSSAEAAAGGDRLAGVGRVAGLVPKITTTIHGRLPIYFLIPTADNPGTTAPGTGVMFPISDGTSSMISHFGKGLLFTWSWLIMEKFQGSAMEGWSISTPFLILRTIIKK